MLCSKAEAKKSRSVLFSGKVLQRGSRDPVEGAGVFLRELRRGVYTNNLGQFGTKIPVGRYTLIIKAIGYHTIRQKLHIKTSHKQIFYIHIDPKQQLQTVVRAKRNRYAPGQVAITRKEIRELPGGLGGDPFRALQNLPGVARANGLSGALRIRGASPADTGFLMDGHSLPMLYHFGGGPAIVNDRFIEKIDFFPGGAPSNYGRFTAGLVSITSRTPGTKGVHGELFLDIIHAGFYLEIPIGKQWSIALAARRSYVDAFIGLLTPDALAARYWDDQLKIAWHSGPHKLSLFVFGSDDLVDYQGRIKGENVAFLGDDPFFLSMQLGRAILQYRFAQGPVSFVLSAAGGFQATQIKEPKQTGILRDWPVELRAALKLRLHKTFHIGFGFDGSWQRQTYKFEIPVGEFLFFPKPSSQKFTQTGEGEKDRIAPAGFLHIRWVPNSSFQIDLGLRVDWFQQQARIVWGLDPRVSLRWKFNNKWSLLASSGLFHRAPNTQQWSKELGNPDLQLQAAFQAASGLEYQPVRSLNIRAQLFFSYMYDRISGSNRVIEKGQTLTREKYNNEGLGRSYGLELLIRLKLWKGLSGWLAYTLSRAERGNSTSGINRLYNYDQTHIMNFLLQYNFGNGWKVGARFRLVSGRPYTPIVGGKYDADRDRFQPVWGPRDSERLPMFHQLDLRVDKTWTFDTWSFGLYLDLINVYNHQNTDRYRYQYDYAGKYPVPGIPIIPAFGLKGAF